MVRIYWSNRPGAFPKANSIGVKDLAEANSLKATLTTQFKRVHIEELDHEKGEWTIPYGCDQMSISTKTKLGYNDPLRKVL